MNGRRNDLLERKVAVDVGAIRQHDECPTIPGAGELRQGVDDGVVKPRRTPAAKSDRAVPALGMMAAVSYREVESQLQSGDALVFMTDGIVEAKDSTGQEYQESGRLGQVIGKFTTDMTAKAMVDALINDATTFGAQMTAYNRAASQPRAEGATVRIAAR